MYVNTLLKLSVKPVDIGALYAKRIIIKVLHQISVFRLYILTAYTVNRLSFIKPDIVSIDIVDILVLGVLFTDP